MHKLVHANNGNVNENNERISTFRFQLLLDYLQEWCREVLEWIDYQGQPFGALDSRSGHSVPNKGMTEEQS